MNEAQKIEEWAREIGGRFAKVLELRSEGAAVFARIRTNFALDGIQFRVPDEVQVPAHYRDMIDRGEINHRVWPFARP